ncbi:MAG TPA: cytidine deaminase [Pirellula sp.]|nr:cytidine deaminase [Pirellula sp.]
MNLLPEVLKLDNAQLLELVQVAQNAALSAYHPYSNFAVGCAILSKSGKIYRGCNIENAAYSVSICAERVAASQAVLQRDLEWDSIVVVSPQRVTPCGVCRQFLHEFAPQLRVWCGYLDNLELVGPAHLHDMLPAAMTLARFN